MNLNNIQLSNSMLASLYAGTLIETTLSSVPEAPPIPIQVNSKPETATAAETVPQKTFRKTTAKTEAATAGFLGGNQKKITILVSHTGIQFLPDGELTFLTSVLAACKLTLNDVAIVNVNNSGEEEMAEKIKTLAAAQVILFGIEPLTIGLPINFPQFQLQQFDGRTYMHSPALTEVEQNKPLKGSLWGSLKNLFGL